MYVLISFLLNHCQLVSPFSLTVVCVSNLEPFICFNLGLYNSFASPPSSPFCISLYLVLSPFISHLLRLHVWLLPFHANSFSYFITLWRCFSFVRYPLILPLPLTCGLHWLFVLNAFRSYLFIHFLSILSNLFESGTLSFPHLAVHIHQLLLLCYVIKHSFWIISLSFYMVLSIILNIDEPIYVPMVKLEMGILCLALSLKNEFAIVI